MAAPRVVVVDYHKGNLSSVARSLTDAGADVCVTDDVSTIAGAGALVLPGVGAFADAMGYLRESGQDEAILGRIREGVPFLGICLGLHLLFERGDEGVEGADQGAFCEGLSVLTGSVAKLESTRLKVPHMGWDQINLTVHGRACPLFSHVADGANAYYTHSYALADDIDQTIVATRSHYARTFASGVWHDNVYGLQFHPEKSSAVGLSILRSFVGVAEGEGA